MVRKMDDAEYWRRNNSTLADIYDQLDRIPSLKIIRKEGTSPPPSPKVRKVFEVK